MIEKIEWEQALAAWEKVHKQAEMDIEQSELYITEVKKKIETFK